MRHSTRVSVLALIVILAGPGLLHGQGASDEALESAWQADYDGTGTVSVDGQTVADGVAVEINLQTLSGTLRASGHVHMPRAACASLEERIGRANVCNEGDPALVVRRVIDENPRTGTATLRRQEHQVRTLCRIEDRGEDPQKIAGSCEFARMDTQGNYTTMASLEFFAVASS